jgi:hypothetical protein
MIELINEQTFFIIRLDVGEDLVSELQKFFTLRRIPSSTFTAIGAANEIILSFYDLTKKQYLDKTIKEELEIVSLNGNSAWMKNKVVLHLHGVFARKDYSTLGGHIKKLVISATGEVVINVNKQVLYRAYDSQTGLNLLSDKDTNNTGS